MPAKVRSSSKGRAGEGGGEVSDGSDDEGLARQSAAAFVERLRSLAKTDGEVREQVGESRCVLSRLLPQTGLGLKMARDSPVFHQREPPCPEPFHHPAEFEEEGIASEPDSRAGDVVYESPTGSTELQEGPATVFVGTLDPWYALASSDDPTLQFESRFESGNLLSAKRGAVLNSYDLTLHADRNTSRHTLWYYFRVANVRPGMTYRFNITNLVKPSSVYGDGMRPCVYSTEAAARGGGWVRGGDQVTYLANGVRRGRGRTYYTLSFSYTCPPYQDGDSVYFAHCFPFTYTDLQKYLEGLESNTHRSQHLRRRPLCYSLAQNRCDVVTVTNFPTTDDARESEAVARRRGIVITARVHPGETPSSWMMKGILDFLTGPSVDAAILRQNFVFQIIPMLNPDGVIVGNYRCCLLGQDLNRCWGSPNAQLQPTIFHAKALIQEMQAEREVILSLDLHGHSRKMNIFLYGNSSGKDSAREQVFPKLLAAQAPYSFDSCCFKMLKTKDGTARQVVYRELGIRNTYTVEASFCGPDFGSYGYTHFSQGSLEAAGHQLCDGMLDLFDPDQHKVKAILHELEAHPHASVGEQDDDADDDKPRSRAPSSKPKKAAEKPASGSAAKNRWAGVAKSVRRSSRREDKDLRTVRSAPLVCQTPTSIARSAPLVCQTPPHHPRDEASVPATSRRRRKPSGPAPTIVAPPGNSSVRVAPVVPARV